MWLKRNYLTGSDGPKRSLLLRLFSHLLVGENGAAAWRICRRTQLGHHSRGVALDGHLQSGGRTADAFLLAAEAHVAKLEADRLQQRDQLRCIWYWHVLRKQIPRLNFRQSFNSWHSEDFFIPRC